MNDHKSERERERRKKVSDVGPWEWLDNLFPPVSSFQDSSDYKIHSVEEDENQFSIYKLVRQITRPLGGLFVCLYLSFQSTLELILIVHNYI